MVYALGASVQSVDGESVPARLRVAREAVKRPSKGVPSCANLCHSSAIRMSRSDFRWLDLDRYGNDARFERGFDSHGSLEFACRHFLQDSFHGVLVAANLA